MNAVILADGEFPKNEIPLDILKNAEYLVCCDGAADKLPEHITPDAIVGDCDSLSAENKARFADRIYRITEQETNDLTKAVHFCRAQDKRNIIILGATGRREDHTLGNISLLAEYIDIEDINISMATDYGIFTAIKETTVFPSRAGQQVSIFDIGRRPATFRNLKYPVENRVLTNWWQGTLNEALGDSFTVETGGKMIVFREW
ncbi:MAG: thiamine diphosphokinase [Prevotellaceae bacterium]|jgi:thiamine pyrophosphokinase|nr:thiamine diphosphokinase [Prevotellaceae bacterium]